MITAGRQNNFNHQENLDGAQSIVKEALRLAAVDKELEYCHKFASFVKRSISTLLCFYFGLMSVINESSML
jgi:hypothetical protein